MRTGYGHMVIDYYVDKLRALQRERAARLGAIRSRRAAEKYRDEMRSVIAGIFQPRPPKTPLNARVTGTIERADYRTEKIVFESRPGFLVTAILYVPERLTAPAPAVLVSCGHSMIGKAEPFYQMICQRLTRTGFVVLHYDPISQGERDQYYRFPAKNRLRTNCCFAHNMMGKQLHLLGEPFCMWRAWDGIRALDYLLSRPEVDRRRVGMTGNSGGGTLTTWLWAIEDRLTMAAPSCFVTTFLANLENELPADYEQYPPNLLGAGLELADFLIARAPEPVLTLGQRYDYFDRRGLEEIHAEVRRFYGHFGAAHNKALFLGERLHAYYPEAQAAALAFFSKQAGVTPPTHPPKPLVVKPWKLFVTQKGQIVPEGSRPVYELIAEKGLAAAAGRKRMGGAELRRRLVRLLGLPARRGAPHFRVLRPIWRDKLARFAVETENGIRALLFRQIKDERYYSPNADRSVTLYLPHFSTEEDFRDEPVVKTLIKKRIFCALDARGLGECLPDGGGENVFGSYGMDYMLHGYGFMFGECYLGRRVHDVLATLDLLAAGGARELRLIGRGQGAILALFGALLHPLVKDVILKNAPLSCHEWTQSADVAWPATNCVPGLLLELDLPDCIRALGARVKLIEPWNAQMKPYSPSVLKRAMCAAGLPAKLLVKH